MYSIVNTILIFLSSPLHCYRFRRILLLQWKKINNSEFDKSFSSEGMFPPFEIYFPSMYVLTLKETEEPFNSSWLA